MTNNYYPIRLGALAPEARMMIFGASQLSLNSEEGQEARNWLLDRGLDVETIANFRLGYVPFSINHPFCGRIVMPIFDSYGKLLALSVRPATNDEAILKEYGKYWNESYEKGWQLYGLNAAKYSIIKERFVILVEGQFDVMAMHAYGFTNTVGVLGGAFTPMQAELLKRWTNQIILMFDGDKAGRDHASHALDILKYYSYQATNNKQRVNLGNFQYTNLIIPSGKDPNDFLLRQGSYPMRQTIINAMKANFMTLPAGYNSAA